MTGRVECLPGCSCRGTDGVYEPGTPCHERAITNVVWRIARDQRAAEVAASKLRHPSNGDTAWR